MANTEIREMLKTEHIPYWRIADVLGVHENTVIRRLRKELSPDDRKRFLAAIEQVKKETA